MRDVISGVITLASAIRQAQHLKPIGLAEQ
jgi:hypothetical protein